MERSLAASETSQVTARGVVPLVILAALIMFVDGADMAAMPLAVPYIVREWGISPAEFGIALSAMPLGFGVGGLLIGPLGDHYGRRPVIIGTVLLVALTTIATAFSREQWHFFLLRFLGGIGLGGCLTNLNALVAGIGPNADRQGALFGCYSFLNHVLVQHPGVETGFEAPTVVEALRAELGPDRVVSVRGCGVDDEDRSGFAEAVAAAENADVAVLVLGDHAGLFGRGTVGEGCDRDSLELPGVQRELAEAVLATGKPVVLVLLTGRPYAIGWAVQRCAAVLQAFFPGEEGSCAIAGILSGRVNPSGRLPVSLPRSAGAQPYTYLHPNLGRGHEVTNLETTPVAPFGHGLSYTTFEYSNLTVSERVPTDGAIEATVTVTNTGAVAGDEVIHLYGHDPVASITRPVAALLGYRRVHLAPGQSVTVRFTVPTTRLAFTDRQYRRIVEPGDVELWVGTSATRLAEARTVLDGPVHPITKDSPRWTTTAVVG